jgi:hypothetical protein
MKINIIETSRPHNGLGKKGKGKGKYKATPVTGREGP